MGVHYANTDPTAVMGRRIGAAFIDLGFYLLLLVVIFIASADIYRVEPAGINELICDSGLFGSFETSDGELVTPADNATCFAFGDNDVLLLDDAGMATTLLLPLLLQVANHVVLQGITGGSLGKLMVGLRVVDQRTGARAGFGAVLVRWLMWIADGIPFFIGPLVGLITSVSSSGHRRVGDMVAKTLVVHKDHVGVPPQVPGLSVPAGHPGVLAGAPPPFTTPPGSAGAGTPPGATAAPPGFTDTPPSSAATTSTIDPNWPAPTPDPQTTAPKSSGDSQPGVGAPVWDEKRDTYIQWDPELRQWMQWDERRSSWRPIS